MGNNSRPVTPQKIGSRPVTPGSRPGTPHGDISAYKAGNLAGQKDIAWQADTTKGKALGQDGAYTGFINASNTSEAEMTARLKSAKSPAEFASALDALIQSTLRAKAALQKETSMIKKRNCEQQVVTKQGGLEE